MHRMPNGGIVPDHNKTKNLSGHRSLKYRTAFKIPQSLLFTISQNIQTCAANCYLHITEKSLHVTLSCPQSQILS